MNIGVSKIGKLTLGVALAAGLVPFAIYTNDRVSVDTVRAMIDEDLSIGASTQEIESFFEQHGLANSFDRFQDRYQSIIRDVSPYSFIDKSVRIYVHTDSERKFVRAEVFLSYTFL